MIRLSVIVPVYNTKKYLKKCIESIINQEYNNIEIILVDDGSTDGSGEICDAYEAMDCRIKVIHQKNKGCILSRLCGVQNSKGEFIGFVDSDDWIASDMYKILMSIAEDKKCDIVSMGYTLVFEGRQEQEDDATLFGLYEKSKNMDLLLSNMMFDMEKKQRGVHSSLCSKVIRKELLEKIYSKVDSRITMGEDAAIFYPCCLNAQKIFIVKNYKYFYRIHNKSMCRDINVDTINRIYFFNQYMQKTLLEYDAKYGLLNQLKYYIWTLVNVELKKLFNLHVENSYVFPYNMIKKNEKIVLYGAGVVGKAFRDQILLNNYCDIIIWVDKYKFDGKSILNPNQIFTLNYSKIVIAVEQENMAKEIINELIELGIDRGDLLWCEPQKIDPIIL